MKLTSIVDMPGSHSRVTAEPWPVPGWSHRTEVFVRGAITGSVVTRYDTTLVGAVTTHVYQVLDEARKLPAHRRAEQCTLKGKR